MEFVWKEVFYDEYCPECAHCEKAEFEDPCCDCLEEPVNQYSRKPMYFEEKEDE